MHGVLPVWSVEELGVVGYANYVAYFGSKKQSFCDSLQGTISILRTNFQFRHGSAGRQGRQQAKWQSMRFVGFHDTGALQSG